MKHLNFSYSSPSSLANERPFPSYNRVLRESHSYEYRVGDTALYKFAARHYLEGEGRPYSIILQLNFPTDYSMELLGLAFKLQCLMPRDTGLLKARFI